MRTMEDIENERPGHARGQGGSQGGGGGGFQDPGPSEPIDGRWNQPILRALLQLDLRNRAASVLPLVEGNVIPRNDAAFYPQWGLELELRPFAGQDDALRGLYARVATSFSIGINYYSATPEVDGDGFEVPLSLQTFGIEVAVGYAGTIAEMVELFASIGFGYDLYQLQLAQSISELDFPSSAYPYLPINAGGRVRLLPASVQGVDLHLEAMVGPRIVLGGGQLAGTVDSEDGETQAYFAARSGAACGNPGLNMCNGDFGGVSGVGINFHAGLGLIIDPGFSAALRFQYTNYFLGFGGGTGSREAISGVDESLHVQIMLGWAIR